MFFCYVKTIFCWYNIIMSICYKKKGGTKMYKKRKKMLLGSVLFIIFGIANMFMGATETNAEKPHSARVSNEMTYLLNYSDGTQIESKNINGKMPHDIVDLESVSIVMKSTVVEAPAANWMDPYGDFFNISSSEYGSETTYFSFESLPKIITNMNTDYFTMEYSKDGILYSKNEPQIGELKAFRVKPRNTTEILPVGEELLIHFDMKLDTDQLIKSDLLANKTEENPYGNVFYPFTGEGNWILSERFPISFTGETKVEVKYVDIDSNEKIATNETITGIIGKEYTSENKQIENYSFVKVDGESEGVFGQKNKQVTYFYKKDKIEPKESVVTTKYVDENQKEIAEQESQSGEIGKPYATESKTIEGYELVESPKNQTGVFGEENIEVVYEYKAVKEQELYVHQEIGSVRYDNNEKVWVSTGHSNWQFRLNESNPSFTVDTDEELKKENPLYPRNSPYTYYGYRIEYKDKTFEIVNDRTLVYKDLIEHGKELGKEIDLIIVFYGPTSTIKVNYNLVKEDGTKQTLLSEEDYGKFDVAYPNLFDVVGESFSLNTVVNNYIPINFDGAKQVKFTDDDQVIDIDFRMPKITIKYQDTLGKVLKESQVSYGKIKDILSIDIPQIEGYDYTNNVSKEISYSREDQEITLIYAPKIEGTVTVRYLDELGKEIAQRVTTTNYVGEEYHTMAKDIPGYELLLTPDNASGTYQEGVITVDYIYHNNIVIPDIEGQVIVKYVDETNEEIASRTELSGRVGEAYQTSAKTIAGYELISEPEMSGAFIEGVAELVYQYKSTNTPVDIEGKVLVSYVDEEGQQIAASVELTGIVNSNYQTSPKDISGYVLKSDSGNTTGHFIEGVQQVTYVYEKTDDGKPDIEGFVTVFYVDKNNKEIADRMSLSGTVGTGYTTSAKELTGYELIETPINATGNFSEGVQNVVYVYQKEDVPEPYVEGNVITKYVTEEGKEIALPEMLTGEVGTNYLTKAKDIPGFELTKEPDNKSGQFVEGTVTVIYVYKQTNTEELVEGTVVVKYVDTKGKEIALADTMSGKLKETYTTAPKKITGYELVEEPKNKVGTYIEGITTVTYIYKENEVQEKIEGKVISKFVDQDGNVIAEEVVSKGKVGDSYLTSKKLISGYDFVKVEGKESGAYTEEIQEVVYIYKKSSKPTIVNPISPVTPTKPITKPTITPIAGGGNKVTTTYCNTLPKTGETENIYLSMIGLVLSMGMFFIFQKKMKENQLN